MNILVCIKQVPGTMAVEVDPVSGVLKRDGVPAKLNPYDLYAIELALKLREEYSGTVSVITMGPPQARSAVMEAICMGADRGLIISDRAFAGADVLATSYTISQGIRKMGQFDLILCGKQTTDGDTAQVGAEIAEFLGMDHAANVSVVESIEGGSVTVRLNLDASIQQQKMSLPCVLCIDKEINTPRLPSYKRKLGVTDEQISMVSLADFEDKDKNHYGLSGSPTSVERIFPPEKNSDKEILQGEPAALCQRLGELLAAKKFI